MNKTIKYAAGLMAALSLCFCTGVIANASDGQEYITISVEAEDNSGTLLYALDTDAPDAFSPSNEFTVPAGTGHTIYVKDPAGNITSQDFAPPPEDYPETYTTIEENERTVNIDITLDDPPAQEQKTDHTDYGYAGDLLYDPAEAGQGTVHEKIQASANDPDAERIFYTVTTDEGEVFYLVIDQGQGTNNVYLLDQVNLSDLKSLAYDDSGQTESAESVSLLSALSGNNNNNSADNELAPVEEAPDQKGNSLSSNLVVLLLMAAIGGGFYYYKNVYKNKKDEQMDLIDALDKEDFTAEEEDDDEADFGLDDDYQERLMQQLMEEDEIPDAEDHSADENENPNEQDGTEDFYATSHEGQEYDADEYDADLDSPDEEDE